jgi:hypothetical protein
MRSASLSITEIDDMKQRFAAPTERDLRFVRKSGFRPEDFGQEVKIINSAVDGAVIVAILLGLLYALSVLA